MEKSCENCCHKDGFVQTGNDDYWYLSECNNECCADFSCWKPDYQTLESELQQYKEALRLAAFDAENEIGCPPAENRTCCKWQGDHSPCIDCITNYYLTKAKGGS